MNTLDWLHAPSSQTGIYFASDAAEAGLEDRWEFESFAALADRIFHLAQALRERGCHRGDAIALVLADPQEFIAAFYACMVAGCSPAPIATPLTFRSLGVYRQHVAQILAVSQAKLLVTDASLAETVEALPSDSKGACDTVLYDTLKASGDAPRALDLRGSDRALLQFTSGSSGTPKGVQVSLRNLDANISANMARLGGPPDQIAVSWLPLYHDMGLIGMLLSPVAAGLELRLMTPLQFLRNPLMWLQALEADRATYTASPSFGYSYVTRRLRSEDIAGLDLSRWRVAILAAERIDVGGVEAFVKLTGPAGFQVTRFAGAYGLAEATLTVTGCQPGETIPLVRLGDSPLRDGAPVDIAAQSWLGDEARPAGNWIAACGYPLADTQVGVIDETGHPLPEGFLGQILVQSPAVADGYLQQDEHSSTNFGASGLESGDTGFVLDGQLYVIGRVGDSIKVRGAKLYAEDLDTKIAAATDLAGGRFATLLGGIAGTETVVVIVESAPEHWEQSWVAAIRTVVAAETASSVALAVFRGDRGTIERTSSGKPRRRLMWRQLLDGDTHAELIATNWSQVSSAPLPWAGQPADAAGVEGVFDRAVEEQGTS